MNTDQLCDAWHSRDLPVLREAARVLDSEIGTGVRFERLAQRTGFTVDEVYLAARALEAENLVALRLVMGPRGGCAITKLGPRAREKVGLWPTPETGLDRMIAALQAIADNTDDEDTRTRARKILDGLAGAGRTIGLGVTTAVITGQIPGT